MNGRRPVYHNDVSRALGARRRALGLSRQAVFDELGIDVGPWERAWKIPWDALGDPGAPYLERLGIEAVRLQELALGTLRPTWQVLDGDALSVLRSLPAASVDCVVTSPPYYRLRHYGVEVDWPEVRISPSSIWGGEYVAPKWVGELGWEASPAEYVAHLVAVMREVWRILRPHGSLWVNLADSRGSSGEKVRPEVDPIWKTTDFQRTSLLGLPGALAVALQADGWIWRDDVVWLKPNAAPRPHTDRRCSGAHEPLHCFVKASDYVWDDLAVREPVTGGAHSRGGGVNPKAVQAPGGVLTNASWSKAMAGAAGSARRVRSVWSLHTEPSRSGFYSSFPSELAWRCIALTTSSAGVCPACHRPFHRRVCRQRLVDGKPASLGSWAQGGGHPSNGAQGVGKWRISTEVSGRGWAASCACGLRPEPAAVLDPFSGAGRTGLAALELGRSYRGIEADQVTLEMQRADLLQASVLSRVRVGDAVTDRPVAYDVQLPLFATG